MNKNVDIAGAIKALSNAAEVIKSSILKLDERFALIKTARNATLNEHVEVLLPDLSANTLARLEFYEPEFANKRGVSDIFANNKKFLWLIKPSGYDASLTMIKTQLKAFLEKSDEVVHFDSEINEIQRERVTLNLQYEEAIKMIKNIGDLASKNKPISDELSKSINHIASKSNLKATPHQSKLSNHAHVDGDDDSNIDLWIWLMTDIPTSFRTLILDESFSVNEAYAAGGGSFSGAGASLGFESDAPVITNDRDDVSSGSMLPQDFLASASLIASSESNESAALANQKIIENATGENGSFNSESYLTSGLTIKTDDSLGAFS